MTPASASPSAADTIVAIATPPGAGAIGVIRISGPDALSLASSLLRMAQGGTLDAARARAVHCATVIDPGTGAELDEILAVKMPAPRSYTGDDVVELSCHGNPVLLAEIVGVLLAQGARLAEPGEFTRRAYLNGRLDLLQVEAVAELIGAHTGRALRLALRQLRGGLSTEIGALRGALLDLMAGLEVALDFPDDEVGVSRAAARARSAELGAALERLVESARRGRAVHDGLSVILLGTPNVGKSSLLNALLGCDRAIVSPTPGTTRDLVDGSLVIRGVAVRLLDGAGLGPPGDAIEAEGMRRARRALEASDLVLVVLDRSRPLTPGDREVLGLTAGVERLVVANKSDLPSTWQTEDPSECLCSALVGTGIDRLRARLSEWVERRTAADGEEGGLVASLRVIDSLTGGRAALGRGTEALDRGAPIEAVLVDLRDALGGLDQTLGIEAGDALLERIFATFCVGK